MGRDACGFIEIYYNDMWLSAVSVHALADRNYELENVLFSKYGGIFGGRGLPVDASLSTRKEFSEDKKGGAFEPTYAMLREIRGINWQKEIEVEDNVFETLAKNLTPGWSFLFKTMEFLLNAPGVGSMVDNVRLVMWFDQ